MNINISMVFMIGLFISIVGFIIIFNYLEKKSQFEIFKKRLEKSSLNEKQKKLFLNIQKRNIIVIFYPFFLFEKIAIKALNAAGIENPEDIYQQIKKAKT